MHKWGVIDSSGVCSPHIVQVSHWEEEANLLSKLEMQIHFSEPICIRSLWHVGRWWWSWYVAWPTNGDVINYIRWRNFLPSRPVYYSSSCCALATSFVVIIVVGLSNRHLLSTKDLAEYASYIYIHAMPNRVACMSGEQDMLYMSSRALRHW